MQKARSIGRQLHGGFSVASRRATAVHSIPPVGYLGYSSLCWAVLGVARVQKSWKMLENSTCLHSTLLPLRFEIRSVWIWPQHLSCCFNLQNLWPIRLPLPKSDRAFHLPKPCAKPESPKTSPSLPVGFKPLHKMTIKAREQKPKSSRIIYLTKPSTSSP